MSKPKIFIAMHYLEIGGAEAALIGMLHAFDYEKVDVDLFIYSHRGELMRFVPDKVNLLPEIKEYSMIESPMHTALLNGCIGVVAGRLMAKYKFRNYFRKNHPVDGNAIYGYIGKYVVPHLPNINHTIYDLAISFLTPHNIVLDKVNAKRKVCWIHTDYSKIDTDAELELPVWKTFDNIVSISPATTNAFCTIFPELRERIVDIENIAPVNLIREQAEQTNAQELSISDFNILSIGRFSNQKNFDNIPEICSHLISITGMKNIRWYIIGFGREETLIKKRIADTGMEEHVIILGKRSNPYPYISKCDLYVQPSRYEGKSVTVREAQMLGKPVVITDYPTAKSQIEHMIDGVIVPMDNTGCAKGIAKVIADEKLRHSLSINTSQRDYSNRSEISKIYSLI